LIIVAHGESWEVAASLAVSNLIKKIIEERVGNKGQFQENGTFNLHYIPANANEHSITIPLTDRSTLPNHHPEKNLEHGAIQDAYFEKIEHLKI
jgi:hypothetical protein